MKKKSTKKVERKAKLIVRNASVTDIKGIQQLAETAYKGLPAYPYDMIFGQIHNFPQGQFVAEYLGEIVLIWFSMIGLWVLQPKLNELVKA